jgi:hypothetical protein
MDRYQEILARATESLLAPFDYTMERLLRIVRADA